MIKWSRSLKIQRMHIGGHIILIIVAAVILVPLYYVAINAFKTDLSINLAPMAFKAEYFTLENLGNAWRLLSFPKALLNSVILVALSSGIIIISGALAGFSIAIVNNRLLRIIYITLVLLISVPFQVILIPIVQILSAMKLMNSYFGTSFVFAAVNMPFAVFLYTGFMRAIPRELCEASIVDGCGMGKTFMYIYMPLMRVVTTTVLILRGTGVWNDLLIPLATITVEKYDPLIRRLYTFASLRFNSWDLLFAGTLLCSVPILLLFLFMQRVFIRGLLVGSVKG
jgi:raffinose/stachyose/melibiose transport system permease protein